MSRTLGGEVGAGGNDQGVNELSGTVTVDQNQWETVLGSGLLRTKEQEQYYRINLSSCYEEEERKVLEAVSLFFLSLVKLNKLADELEGNYNVRTPKASLEWRLAGIKITWSIVVSIFLLIDLTVQICRTVGTSSALGISKFTFRKCNSRF